jgi:hypothetical protein
MTIQIQNAVIVDANGPLEVDALLIVERHVEATGGAAGNWTDREFKADFADMVEEIETRLADYDVDGAVPAVVKVTEWQNGSSDISATARLAVEYHVRARIAKK